MKQTIVFLIILIIATIFRFTGLNWDANQHLHPDERFLTMVANGISWPESISQYFDTASSPLNPHNRGFDFFVYGTFPIFLVKAVAEALHLGDYNHLTLVGRAMSAVIDLGTVVLVFLIAKKFTSSLTSLLSMFIYSIMTFPIQLAHFYTTDPYLTFFLTLTLYCLTVVNKKLVTRSGPVLGISFGLALASKISAIYFLPIIAIYFLYRLIRDRQIILVITQGILFVFIAGLTLKIAQPYLFTNFFTLELNSKVLVNWQQLKSFDDIGFPPAIQWIGTTPYLYPLIQGFFWGVGPVIGILSIFGIILAIVQHLPAGDERSRTRRQNIIFIIIPLWLLIPFLLQGGQFVKAIRYFTPLYPALAIFAGLGFTYIYHIISKINNKWLSPALHLSLLILLFIWPLAFFSIYIHPHTRVTASEWIYQNIPTGSVLSSDHWDDGLPLCLSVDKCRQFEHEELHLFDPDSPEKWAQINAQLEKVDYLIITSNRTYAALGTVPEKFPLTNNFYSKLFAGKLNFIKVAEFTSRPSVPFPFSFCIDIPFFNYGRTQDNAWHCNTGVSIIDDFAEETWTVYDHPKVMIFKKTSPPSNPSGKSL